MYMFWELVGVSSYLLIGHWFEKDSAANASKKAFLTNRVGDIGFFIGIMLIYNAIGSFAFGAIFDGVESGLISGTILDIFGYASIIWFTITVFSFIFFYIIHNFFSCFSNY